MKSSIVVAVADPALHPEVMHIAAATGRSIVDATAVATLRSAAPRADAVLLDREMASELGMALEQPRVFFVAGDPGPVDWQLALRCGATDGFVVPAQAPDLLRVLGQRPREQHSSALAIGVVGAVGGCGTSVFASALAQELGAGAVLIDADPFSGGLDLLLGAEECLGARWNDLSLEHGPVDGDDLLQALPEAQGVRVLTVARGRGTVASVSASAVAAAVESVRGQPTVVDLPRHLLEAQDVVQKLGALVVLVPAELRAVAAVVAELTALRAAGCGASIVCVVRHRGWSGLDEAEVATLGGVEVAAAIPTVAGLAKSIELRGMVRVPRSLRQAARLVREAVSSQ
ncbi:septum site-determining protein Ssd [Corynebacterium sp. H127]|uniref:septum site-determining protein Ssd n=1 Tax=Corynebacterium sp. H127 TaxID=3133418 RepID=UPI0030A2868F